ncbi:lonely Cys domain-containing protein [Streptomyces sp. NPDC002793]|uniref:lonely Cys domain-containing protein n=1 Tax=Streptomyces sp. NPDC002793 TaxID=3154432 RepID=UPI00331A70B5
MTGDGRVLLGSEQPSAILTQEQFDALLDGMRRETPDLTADQLRKDLDGLGHTGIAARFGESGRSEPGMSRVSGEFLWSKELKRWTVNDKSGRYMSESVRPGLDPDVAAGWLQEVARLFTDRLGVRVVPEQVKTASAAPADPPAPPAVVPLKGMVSLAELDAIGVTLSLAQSTQAAMLGDRLPVEELDLTPEHHRLVRVQRGEPDTSAPTQLLLDSPEPSSPEGSVDSLDMILDWEDGDGEDADGEDGPPAEPDHHRILEDLYGPGIDAAPLYTTLRETLVRLDTLRRSVAASPLRDGPFDLDAVTRYVLGLDEQAPVTKTQRGELFRVALDENVEGATSLAGLAAFRLVLDGVFSVARTLPRTGGSRGRNWTGGRIRNLDTSRAVGTAQQPYGEPPLGGTDPAPYVVLAAEGGHDHVVVLDGDGTRHRVTTEVFAELLALDPVLAGLPDDTPVVLLVPEAGARGLDLPRAVADRTGHMTWATSGSLRFTPQTADGPAVVSPEHRPGETTGTWSVSEPGEVLGPDDLADAPAWESEVVSYTQVAEGRSIGRFVFHPAEAARFEGLMRQMPSATELWHQNPVTGVLTKDPDPVPWAGRPAYFFAAHGFPGMTDMALEDGTSRMVRSTATGGFLRRRPSVARLSDDHVIVMDECWHATAGGPDFVNGDSPLMPYVADPLATVSDAQHTANETGRTVFASTRPSGIQRLSAEQGGGYVRILSTDPRGARGRWLEFRPEPSGAALDEVARAAGLHQDDGPAPPAVRDAALRLVRALRTVFGADVDQAADHPRLLAGIGALEAMRGRDPWLADVTPFTLDLLDQAVREISGTLPDGPPDGAVLGADDYRAALLHAATAPGTDAALTAFVPLPLLVEAARQLDGLDGPGALDAETARVLRRPDGAEVGPAQRTRLFWATAAALAWERRSPDPDSEGARILHLERADPARRGELVDLVAMAAAVGRDLDDPTALAAFHLEVLGALAPETRLLGADGTTTGRTWFPSPRTPGPLNTDVLVTALPKPGGGHQPGGVEPAPWKTSGGPAPYVIWAPGNSGHLLMSLPGRPVLRVPYDEVGELLSRDRDLVGRPLRTDVVLAVREAGAPTGADPRDIIGALTGRGVWTTTDKVFLTGNAAPGSPYVVVSLRDPSAPGAPSAAGSWSRLRPEDSARQDPATTVVPTEGPGFMLTLGPGASLDEHVPSSEGEFTAPTPASAPVPAPAEDGPAPQSSPPPGTRVAFEHRHRDITDPVQRRHVAELAELIVVSGLRDLRAGLRIPRVTVTGYSNGPRFALSGGAVEHAETVGGRRAEAVRGLLLDEIRHQLELNERAVRNVQDVRGMRIRAEDFPIVTESGGRDIGTVGPLDGATGRAARRQAVITVDRSPLSAAVTRLAELSPADFGEEDYFAGPNRLARSLLHLEENPGDDPDSDSDSDSGSDSDSDTDAGADSDSDPGEEAPGKDPATDALSNRVRRLYELVDEAMAAGRATSRASLSAYHLGRQGLLSDATRLTAPDGTPLGRNWTGRPVQDVDVSSYDVVDGGDQDARQPLWAREPGAPVPYVIGTKGGDHSKVGLALPDAGKRWELSSEEFAELLSQDAELAKRELNAEVVLVSENAGALGLDLPRRAAARVRRTVWSHSGEVALGPRPDTGRHRIEVTDDRVLGGGPMGEWIGSGPDDLGPDEGRTGPGEGVLHTSDGRTLKDGDVLSYTLTDEGRPVGRAVLPGADVLQREPWLQQLTRSTEWYVYDPVTGKPAGGPRPVPWKGRKPYFFLIHGLPGLSRMVDRPYQNDVSVPGSETGGFLRRRPSLARMDRDAPIVFLSCWGSGPEGHTAAALKRSSPFVPDPFAVLSAAQDVSNVTRRDVYAPTREHLSRYADGKLYDHGIATTPAGDPVDMEKLRPEPTPDELDALAASAGLETSPDLTPAMARDTALRLVRALRITFGFDVEHDRDDPDGTYHRLLRGIGALDVMRRGDADLRDHGELTLDLLHRVTRAHHGPASTSGARPVPPDPADVRAMLEAASARVATDRGTALSAFVSLPSVDRARELIAQAGPDRWAREVLGLRAPVPVTTVHRQNALWATVRAVESVEDRPDPGALVTKVLHLGADGDPRDEALRAELLRLAAAAAALGRDTHDPTVLAAYHLERNGALDARTLLTSRNGTPAGRSWTGRTAASPLWADRYVISPDGDMSRTGALAPWAGRGAGAGGKQPGGYVLDMEGTTPGRVDMTWPDGGTRSVPYEEIAELLLHDPVLAALDRSVPVVPLGAGAGDPHLAGVVAARTGAARTVWLPKRPLHLLDLRPRANESYLVMVSPQDTGTPEARAEDWTEIRPPDLAASSEGSGGRGE